MWLWETDCDLKEIAETFYTKVLQERILQKGNSHLHQF